jgi:hypothetical protein
MTRRRIALVLTILWIVGFELMPWLHIALHDHLPHHHHEANGADIVDDHDGEVDEHLADDHDAEVDEHAADHDDDHDAEVDEHGVPVHVAHSHAHHHDDDAEVALLRALAHGRHSFAHHGIAVPAPGPVVTTPLPVDRRPITLAVIEQPPWLSAPVPEASARGPPALLG